MKSIIKELWRGNVMPPEDGRQNTPEMQQLLEYISRHNDDLLKTMTDEQKEIKSRPFLKQFQLFFGRPFL